MKFPLTYFDGLYETKKFDAKIESGFSSIFNFKEKYFIKTIKPKNKLLIFSKEKIDIKLNPQLRMYIRFLKTFYEGIEKDKVTREKETEIKYNDLLKKIYYLLDIFENENYDKLTDAQIKIKVMECKNFYLNFFKPEEKYSICTHIGWK